MYIVKLPIWDWFAAGNVYTGSLRPDTTRGCLSQTTFHYKVQRLEDEVGSALSAVCFFALPWNQSSTMSEAYLGKFEASNFGVEVCENWILSKALCLSTAPRLAVGTPILPQPNTPAK